MSCARRHLGAVRRALPQMPAAFSTADVQGACPSVSREVIILFLNRLRESNELHASVGSNGVTWGKSPR